MGALAGLLAQDGHQVRGSDESLYPPMSTQLEAAGIPVFRGFSPENLDWAPDRVVVGNVCSRDHVEVRAAQDRGIPLESFPSMLASALLGGRDSLVVAGTHGKTTTASLLAWLLRTAGQDPSFLIGGVPLNLERGYHLGQGRAFVLEGDEYDTAFFDKKSKFLHYRPRRAILTSVEFDHADIFSGLDEVRAAFREFVALIPEDGDLIVHLDDSEAMGIAAAARGNVLTYRVLSGRDGDVTSADYCARVVTQGVPRRTRFEVFEHGESLGEFSTQLVGRYNLANILAALALARREGADADALREGVRRFRGVRRRQELLGVAQGVRVIDDFAHHPTAVALTVAALRKRYPDQSLHVCFEPRSASSRRAAFQESYAGAFDAATTVSIGPLYCPQKVPEGERLDPVALARAIAGRGVPARAFDSVDALLEHVAGEAAPGDTVVVLSSGSFGGLGTRLLHALGDPVTFATAADGPAIDNLLAAYRLPGVVREPTVETLVVRTGDEVVGCVSLDVRGDCGFLFGLAIAPERRGEGLGWVLGDCVMRHARVLGAREIYLITSTATDFFGGKLGFSPVDMEGVAACVADTPNFRANAQIPGAVCMRFELPPDGPVTPSR